MQKGAGIYLDGSAVGGLLKAVTVTNCAFSHNSITANVAGLGYVSALGVGIYLLTGSDQVKVANSSFVNNSVLMDSSEGSCGGVAISIELESQTVKSALEVSGVTVS